MGSLHGTQTTSTTATHPRRTQHRARMATPSGHRHPHQLPSRTPRKPRSTQHVHCSNPNPDRTPPEHSQPSPAAKRPPTLHLPHLYRLLLLRRLRRPLPLTSRFCRCRRALDPFGEHRAACAQAGILRSRGGPLERAAARI